MCRVCGQSYNQDKSLEVRWQLLRSYSLDGRGNGGQWAMGARRQMIDVTYSFFVALGIALILILIVAAVQARPDLADETRERVGFLLLFPVSIAAITGTIGFALAMINWRE